MKHSDVVLKEFFYDVPNRGDYCVVELNLQFVDPQKIVGITNTYNYPEILTDRKMLKLKKDIEEFGGWNNDDKSAWMLQLLELPNGDYVVEGDGNHRSVLAKEMGLTNIKARVKKLQIKG